MNQFVNTTPTGSTGSLTFKYPNGTQDQQGLVLLTSFTETQCFGPIDYYGQGAKLPLVDCTNDTMVQQVLEQHFDCIFFYNSYGGCQLEANSTINTPNLFAFLDSTLVEAVSTTPIDVSKLSIDKPTGDLFRNTLIGIIVGLAAILCISIFIIWRRFSCARLDRAPNAHPTQKIEPLELDLFETFTWNPSSQYTECSVCLEEYTKKQKLRRLWCGHVFHKTCVDRWLQTHRFCPLCRSEFNE